MASLGPVHWWRAFLRLPNDSHVKTFGMALLVSGVCAMAVSLSAVTLKPVRQANLRRARTASMLATLRSLPGLERVLGEIDVEQLTARVVDLSSGELLPDAEPPLSGDGPSRASATVVIPEELDLARIGTREPTGTVYLLPGAGESTLVVLPVYGQGYQSMLRGYVVLAGDLETVAALGFYEQQETPGIGSRITDPTWLASFQGKRIFARDGSVALEIVQGGAALPHQIDGISGATRTVTGVHNLLRYWLGPHGYGPFLARFEARD